MIFIDPIDPVQLGRDSSSLQWEAAGPNTAGVWVGPYFLRLVVDGKLAVVRCYDNGKQFHSDTGLTVSTNALIVGALRAVGRRLAAAQVALAVAMGDGHGPKEAA